MNDRDRIFLAAACLWLKHLATPTNTDDAMRARLQAYVHGQHTDEAPSDRGSCPRCLHPAAHDETRAHDNGSTYGYCAYRPLNGDEYLCDCLLPFRPEVQL